MYLFVLLGSLIIPLIYTAFVNDVIKRWWSFVISTSIVAMVFLAWDYMFTTAGVWGFNSEYCLGYNLLGMPIEEWLFFIFIPFVSIFTHLILSSELPNFKLQERTSRVVSIALIITTSSVLALNLDKLYTSINALVLLITLVLGSIFYPKKLQQFYMSFLVLMFPFLLVNGILTGMFTSEPVVWYNDLENLQKRILTIPIEDFGYAFSMLFCNLMIFEALKSQQKDVSIPQ